MTQVKQQRENRLCVAERDLTVSGTKRTQCRLPRSLSNNTHGYTHLICTRRALLVHVGSTAVRRPAGDEISPGPVHEGRESGPSRPFSGRGVRTSTRVARTCSADGDRARYLRAESGVLGARGAVATTVATAHTHSRSLHSYSSSVKSLTNSSVQSVTTWRESSGENVCCSTGRK